MDATIRCVCPPRNDAPQHDTDTITLRDRLDFRAGLTIRRAISLAKDDDPGMTGADVLAILTEHYLLHGITSWTLADRFGKPIEVNRVTVRAFMEDHVTEALDVGDVADEAYAEQVLLPLLERARANRTSSPGTPTTPSTSAPTGSTRRTSSRRSSTSTTPTDDTATTTSSHDGASSSSPTSASAA